MEWHEIDGKWDILDMERMPSNLFSVQNLNLLISYTVLCGRNQRKASTFTKSNT